MAEIEFTTRKRHRINRNNAQCVQPKNKIMTNNSRLELEIYTGRATRRPGLTGRSRNPDYRYYNGPSQKILGRVFIDFNTVKPRTEAISIAKLLQC